MQRGCCLLLWLAIASVVNGQPLTRQDVATVLGFENNTAAGVFPGRWGGSTDAVIVTDNQVVHGGRFSARIERNASVSSPLSTLTGSIPLDFAGRTIELRGFLKWENVVGQVSLWLRVDGDSPNLALVNQQALNLNGTRDWALYSITVPALAIGKQLVFGFYLTGTGKAWVDDLQLLVDGMPVAQAATRPVYGVNTDHEFDQGSRVNVTSISNSQAKNLATLAKVWGFLKYHHPALTSGVRHWDYDLFRVLPQVLNATDTVAANAAILDWVRSLGTAEDCTTCASLDSRDLYLAPDIGWIRDTSLLGADLSQALQTAYRNRRSVTSQFYVSLTNLSNPLFDNELNYSTLRLPDSGYQLLALFRFWNMVQYFYPNRDIIADDPAQSPDYWNKVLEEFIPRIALASNTLAYQQELLRFIAKINDTHANLWSSLAARPPIGACQLPVDVRFVEGKPIIFRYTSTTTGTTSKLLLGDIIEQLDGIAVDDLVNQWRPFYADSNEAARLRDIGTYFTRGTCGPAAVIVRRGNVRLNVDSSRVPITSLDLSASFTHDRAGGAFQMLADDIAYLKLSSVRIADSANYVRAAANTQGLIIDIRNYPSEFVVFSLGQLLVSEVKQFVRFTSGDITNPGAFHYLSPPPTLFPQLPHYSGKVVILVDEITQSQAEYTTMAFRTAPGAIVIGSTTAGADGDISLVPLPGGLYSYISGLGVFYPDGRPTQRVGIIPDLEVTQTIEGIRAGRDEVLEEAIRQIRRQPTPNISFSLKDQGTVSVASSGTASNLSVGYGIVQPSNGNTPSAFEIIGLHQNNVLVSETAVPASRLLQTGRIYAEINATVNTGLAIMNPGSQSAAITFYFTDDGNGNFGGGTVTIPAKGQIAAFLNESPFNGRTLMTGTFSFASSVPVAVMALRKLTNRRGELLFTTLPVIDLNTVSSTGALVVPYFADGGGWITQIVLSNPTDNVLTGTVQFRNAVGQPLTVKTNNQSDNSFAYSIAPRSAQKLETSGAGTSVISGSVRIVPAVSSASPASIGILSFRNGTTTVSETSLPAVQSGNSFRIYAQATGNFKTNGIGSIQTGIAVTNTTANAVTATVELFTFDGSSTGLKSTLSIPANGQVAAFLSQIPEFAALQSPFLGTLRVASSAALSVTGFRGRYNERRDLLITTIPALDETAPPITSPLYFAHVADSAGYTTQFIMFDAHPGESSSGTLSLFDQSGGPMSILLR